MGLSEVLHKLSGKVGTASDWGRKALKNEFVSTTVKGGVGGLAGFSLSKLLEPKDEEKLRKLMLKLAKKEDAIKIKVEKKES
jgi:hypothetical protein